MKRGIITTLLLTLSAICHSSANDYLISTESTSLVISATAGEKALVQYYGVKISQEEIEHLKKGQMELNTNSYPTFGVSFFGTKAINVTHPDGNMTLDLIVDGVSQSECEEGAVTKITLKDRVYPFVVTQCVKVYKGSDVISMWVEIENNAKKPVTMYKFASAYLPIPRGDNYISHLHGTPNAEHGLVEERITTGEKIITDTEGVRNGQYNNPSVMITLDGAPSEEWGNVIGGTLAWGGNYRISAVATNKTLELVAGIDGDNSYYKLAPKERFVTPEFAVTYSTQGKGGVSRAFHKWATKYKLNQGDKVNDILLNSWEGVYFKINQQEMYDMTQSIADMGGELFVMDDGWFGDKYPRNNGATSLGDWMVSKEKLPEGVEGLVNYAKKCGIKFGIWIEPEMINTKSELFEQHPEWVLGNKNRDLVTGRGDTQAVLDLANPAVQDFVFEVVDDIMTANPEVAYIKWDANCGIANYGSSYLPRDKQSHIYIDYHRGLESVLKRVRAKYPTLVMQACASGGGRINYGDLPYFNEFWTSDNTDALQRIYMQWGVSSFYPAMAMASHVSADKNHQTGRAVPLKFRFDVAMSGRLGLEIQPKNMSEQDREFAKRAIASYKSIRDVVQKGELYRLISPYDKRGVASLMYADEQKSSAVLFVYKTEHMINQTIPNICLSGLDSSKFYKIVDLTPANSAKPSHLDGQIISGQLLKESGLALTATLKGEYSSLVLSLEEVSK